jgi:HEAT repeat protein
MFATARLAAGLGDGALASTQSSSPSTSSAAQQLAEAKRAEIARYTSILQSGDEEERREAALMLGAMRDPATTAALRTALEDKSERVRATALAALSLLREPSFAPLIATYLTKDKSPFVRKAAAYALGQFATSEATPGLTAGLRDKDMEVRGSLICLTPQPLHRSSLRSQTSRHSSARTPPPRSASMVVRRRRRCRTSSRY